MDKSVLKQYTAIQREITALDKSIDKLRDRALDIPVVQGKVTGSSRDWPYIETHYTVLMDEPREADMLSRRIRIKEQRKQEAEQVALEIEQFIAGIPDSTDRQIFELIFLEGKTQQEVAEIVHLERSWVSRRIERCLQEAHKAQK